MITKSLNKSIIFHIKQFGQQIHMIPIPEMAINNNTTIPIAYVVARNFRNIPETDRLDWWLAQLEEIFQDAVMLRVQVYDCQGHGGFF